MDIAFQKGTRLFPGDGLCCDICEIIKRDDSDD